MQECPKCKSESVYWHNERIFDEQTHELIAGYWKCYACAKEFFEKNNLNDTSKAEKFKC